MKKSIFKQIIGGIFIGALVFFTGPLLLIVFLLKFIFTPFGMGRMAYGRFGNHSFGGPVMMGGPRFAFADKVRSMSDEEYLQFKAKMEDRFQGCGHKTKETN